MFPASNSSSGVLHPIESGVGCGEHLRVNGMADVYLPVGGEDEVGALTEAETAVGDD